jgi:hypothetical protein
LLISILNLVVEDQCPSHMFVVVCTPDVLGYIMLHPFLWSLKNITGLVASTPSLGPHLVVADWYWFREFRISLPYSESC